MSSPFEIPQLPAELRALLDDPRLADMKDSPDKLASSTRVLEPRDPPKPGDSRYLQLRTEYDEPNREVNWVNRPRGLPFLAKTGEGRGFSQIAERPIFHASGKRTATQPDVWFYTGWLIASPAFVQLLQQFDPNPIAMIDIDWTFADGDRLEGYVFLDVCRLVPAYDYERTRIVVAMRRGEKSVSHLAYPRALKPDVDPAVHIFRDAFYRSDVFLSRPLAKAIAEARLQGVRFEDPASGDAVTF